jgi:hypothetical protein
MVETNIQNCVILQFNQSKVQFVLENHCLKRRIKKMRIFVTWLLKSLSLILKFLAEVSIITTIDTLGRETLTDPSL